MAQDAGPLVLNGLGIGLWVVTMAYLLWKLYEEITWGGGGE